MAGGDAQILRAPYPKGEDGYVMIQSKAFDMSQSHASDFIVDAMTVPFAFKAYYAEFTGDIVTETTAITVNVEDDTSTPKVLIADAGVAAIVTGSAAVQALTVDRTKTINAGAILKFSYKSGSTDSGVNCCIRLWVKPVY